MKVWLVWEDDFDYSSVVSVHASEAGAQAEAERLAREEWERHKAEHDRYEAKRVATAGSWSFGPFPGAGRVSIKFQRHSALVSDGTVETIVPGVFIPADPPLTPEPFPKSLANYERRVTEEAVLE